MQKYVNLHGHSTYSVLDSIGYPRDILERAKKLGFKSIALTDHGNMNMVADLYLAAREFGGIKPIYGCESYFIRSLDKWKEEYEIAKENKAIKKNKNLRKYYHLILLAKNKKGLENLQELIYVAQRDGLYYKPRLDRALLEKYKEGLICSTACIAGIIQQIILDLSIENKGYDEIKEVAREDIEFFKNTFGDDFYFELQINELPDQKISNNIMLKLAKEFNIEVIITGDCHYIEGSHNLARDVMMAIKSKSVNKSITSATEVEILDTANINDEEIDCRELYLKTDEENYESAVRMGHDYLSREIIDECFKNTLKIDEKIEDIEIDTSTKLIKYETLSGDSFTELEELCRKKLESKRKSNKDISENYEIYSKRLDRELEILKEKKIYDYFLVYKDIVEYAKTQMLSGVGRGSAAGALVCYLLDITKVDPVKYDLLFFRFINLSRKELPDIDTDFEDPEVIKEHLRKKYGETNVPYISTYGTYQMKALLKDYCKVFDIMGDTGDRFFYSNQLTKSIDREIINTKGNNEESGGVFLTYEDYLKSSTFRKFIEDNKGAEQIIKALYGQIRQVGKHAAGILIVDNLIKKMPLQVVREKTQTAYTEGVVNKNLGKMGFVKFDLLGLNTLKIINDSIKLISKEDKSKYKKLRKKINPDNIDFDDVKVYEEVFHRGNFLGVFQFSEIGMQDLCKQVKPLKILEVADIIALFRPGPLANNFHSTYVKRKNGKEVVKYLDTRLEEISKRTYGLLIYQEQIMQTGMKLGNLTEVESNDLRKILVKLDRSLEGKSDSLMDELRKKFMAGAIENNCTRDKAKEIWEIMRKFSGYAFNLSHSLCYAITAYQCAWLKTYYPKEFFCSLLSNTKDEKDYPRIFSEMERFGISIKRPDINKSGILFTIDGDSIRYGLSNIMGVGEKTAKILDENKPYDSVADLLKKKLGRSVTKKTISGLIFSNAFKDSATIGEIVEEYPIYNLVIGDEENIGKLLSRIEKSLLRYNVSFISAEEKRKIQSINEFVGVGKLTHYDDIKKGSVNFYGIIKSIEAKKTKAGKDMLKIRLEDLQGGAILLMCFSESIRRIEKDFGSYENALFEDDIIFFKGKLSYFHEMKMLNLTKLYKFPEK